MKTYRDRAIVLRSFDLGEADRIITMLTRDNGKVRAVAKGVRKTKSRFGARVEPFSVIDIQLYHGRSLDIVSQVESVNTYGRYLVANYERFTAATAMLDVADRLTGEDPDPEQFDLLHGAIHAAAVGAHLPDITLNSYMLRSMAISGWQLAIFECARCGLPGPHQALHVPSGGAVCDQCRPAGAMLPSVETWQLLGALQEGDWAIADRSSSSARRAAQGIVAAFVQWHVESTVKSLRHVQMAQEK
ncbi:DNA repair protein RecO [Trueperella sp. LYQ143]|uniref:DNA repair protein RecO n=1 Tax=unclassified Trueperella TaxID=2630174 RepID=UPI003982D754